jgi:hypothetical protein
MFGNWSNPNAPKQYWLDITAMAKFIAATLQHPNPRCNSRNHRISTIKVMQHKEKFGAVNVYCELADINMVADEWTERGGVGEPTSEFIEQCFIRDARVYRNVYVDMIKLVPHYRKALTCRADYYELLFMNKEKLDVWLEANGDDSFFLTRYSCQHRMALVYKFDQIYA